ncbi:hypothetical protein [Halobacterium litoreum]|uniref:Uncharacterized protein n=1 Tax=Halobacterium litoreum TaxID=2039234 RepID=A0ABD5NE00_9EURY|nr:hypothetical protein [Halobacterium litoreum]UHH13852.1 hypothetical protein LT972_02375 [Halobacterium litoreum]
MTFASLGLWLLEVAALAALCVGFGYPVIAYSQNVLYREGVVLLTAAFGCLVVGAVLELAVDAGAIGVLGEVVAYVWYAVSGLVSVAATWQFAREFVEFGEDGTVDVDRREFVGGFEDER